MHAHRGDPLSFALAGLVAVAAGWVACEARADEAGAGEAGASEAGSGEAKTGTAEIWAGHQLTLGSRSVPILGTLETRTDLFVLATVERDGDEIRMEQQLCKMDIARFAGVKVSLLAEGLPKMPRTNIVFHKSGDAFVAEPWSTHWAYEDVDGDGKPGATVQVEAPICGGTLFVGSTSRSFAKATPAAGALSGELRVSVAQKILQSSGGCLGLVARDTEEKVSGTFAYVPVAAGSTCESLLAAGWPAHAPEAKAAPPKSRNEKERIRGPR